MVVVVVVLRGPPIDILLYLLLGTGSGHCRWRDTCFSNHLEGDGEVSIRTPSCLIIVI